MKRTTDDGILEELGQRLERERLGPIGAGRAPVDVGGRMTLVARVKLWGRTIGAVAMVDGQSYASFQYTPGFLKRSIQVAPLTMPLSNRVWSFPSLPTASFRGLPGLRAKVAAPRPSHLSSGSATPAPGGWGRWDDEPGAGLQDLSQVGTSAGGAR